MSAAAYPKMEHASDHLLCGALAPQREALVERLGGFEVCVLGLESVAGSGLVIWLAAGLCVLKRIIRSKLRSYKRRVMQYKRSVVSEAILRLGMDI